MRVPMLDFLLYATVNNINIEKDAMPKFDNKYSGDYQTIKENLISMFFDILKNQEIHKHFFQKLNQIRAQTGTYQNESPEASGLIMKAYNTLRSHSFRLR